MRTTTADAAGIEASEAGAEDLSVKSSRIEASQKRIHELSLRERLAQEVLCVDTGLLPLQALARSQNTRRVQVQQEYVLYGAATR